MTPGASPHEPAAAGRGGRLVVESVETVLVDLPLVRPHRFRDTTMDFQAVALVRVRTRDGVVGFGEGVVPGGPWWGGESVETMKAILDGYLAPLAVGADLERLPALRARMDRLVAANPFAKRRWRRPCGTPGPARSGCR